MKPYQVYRLSMLRCKTVKQGCSYPGFFFSIIWALAKNPWKAAGLHFLAIFIAAPISYGQSLSAVPAELVGEWQGDNTYYRILPDGHYQEVGILQSTLNNCTLNITLNASGTLGVQGSTLIFTPSSATSTMENSCQSGKDVKSASLDQKSYQWWIERTPPGGKLCLRSKSIRGDICLSKKARR